MKYITITLLLLSSLLANAQQPPLWAKVKLASGDSAKMFIIDWRDIGSVLITKPNTTKTIQLEAGRTFFPNAIYLDGFDQTKAHTVEIKITPVGGVTTTTTVTVDDAHASMAYTGVWNHAANQSWTANYYLNSGSYSSTKDNTVTFTFSGTAVELYAEKRVNHGGMAISIDNGPEVLVDTYSTSTANGSEKVFERLGLINGNHTIKVRVTGVKNPAAASNASLNANDKVDVSVLVDKIVFFSPSL
jgi:hypothetical protein